MTGRKKSTRTLSELMAMIPGGMMLNLGPTNNPEYYPRRHTVETYRSQQRKAKKRRKFRARQSKRKQSCKSC